jgi:hypothetical protein
MIRRILFVFALIVLPAGVFAQDADEATKVDTSETKMGEKANLPFIPERFLEYTATEASWVSLDARLEPA